jgi:hypothetical protein
VTDSNTVTSGLLSFWCRFFSFLCYDHFDADADHEKIPWTSIAIYYIDVYGGNKLFN